MDPVTNDRDVYMTEWNGHRIRKLSLGYLTGGGAVTTLAGSGVGGFVDGTGSAAQLSGPEGIVYDAGTDGFMFCDNNNHAIRRVSKAGVVTTVAGSGNVGSTDGSGSAATFSLPRFLTATSGVSPVFYISERGNCAIRRMTGSGVVTTVVASCGGGSSGFSALTGIAWRPADGNIYTADSIDSVIRSVTPGGAVSLLAGAPGAPDTVDGTLLSARFKGPQGIAFDGAGNLIVADYGGYTIRQVSFTAGTVSTLAGLANTAGLTDGTGSAARFGGVIDLSYSAQLKCMLLVEHDLARIRSLC